MAKVELNVVELLKYMNETKKSNEKSERSSATRRDKQKIDWSKVDLVEALAGIEAEESRIKAAKEMVAKMLKKEEKKDDKKEKPKMSIEQMAAIFMVSFFILGPIMNIWLRKMGL